MITLLHVSDAHFGVHNPGDHKRITDGVLTAITEHRNQGRSSPDFCIFSGDLTQSAAPDQFAKAEQWLKTLSERASGVPIFLVPGNHDVQRPPEGSQDAKDIKRQLRAATHSDESYNEWLPVVKTVPLLHPFFEWHEQAKLRVPIKSTWTLDSPFVCHYTTLLNGITVHLIGLNTATLSCDNDDKCQLVADETVLNNELADASSSPADLVIVVTHHPVKVGEHLEQWLADWNDKRLAPLLLDRKGPHLYLHGHLHRGMGISTSLNTSEILTSFGAGAVYAHDSYPMKFAFYDIKLTEGEIKPWMYNYERKSWFERPSESVVVGGRVLPVPPGAGNKELHKRADTLQAALESFSKENRQLRNAYKRSHEVVARVVRDLYPVAEGLRHQFNSISNHTIIHANGDITMTATFVITPCSEQPIHFWETGLWADPESAKMPFIDDIKLEILDLGNTHVTYLPTLDEGWEKTFCVFFLPQIKPQESRKIKLVYRWPGYAPHFLNGDRIWFEWSYKTGLPNQPVGLEFILDIDQLIGPIDYRNEGRTDDTTKWKIVQQKRKSTDTRLRYQCNNGKLTGAYKVVVWRTGTVSAAPATSDTPYK
jgi:hypothetical protein